MASELLLQARSGKPGASLITLISGQTKTGYALQEGVDWGNAAWDKFYSGPRGTQGARLAGATAQNRLLTIPLEVIGSSTDDLMAKHSVLARLADEFRRFGGVLTWRPKGSSFKQYIQVLDGGVRAGPFDRDRFQNASRLYVELGVVSPPYANCDPMDVFDTFDSDSGEWVVDAGTNLAISGGQLVPSATGNTRWRHTRYASGDCQATLKITTGSTVASYEADVFVASDTAGADTNLSAQLFGGNLRLVKFVAGAQTVLNTTPFALSTNTTYWLRIRREGRVVVAMVYTSEPTPGLAPSANAPASLSISDNWAYFSGHAGFRLNVVATTERYDDFRAEPFTYGGPAALGAQVISPDDRSMRPTVPGDAPPLVDLVVTQSGGASAPIWALAGWYERPSVWNYVWNGDFEDDVDGWSVAAVAGVLANAGTSVTRSTSAARNKYGGANAQIVCPATANSGVTFKINRRFYQGRDYVLLIWASSAAQTTAAGIRLGVSGDIADNTAAPATLSSTPKLYAGAWTPTADRDGAYAVFQITAATATTLNIDGVVVCESRAATLDAAGIATTGQTTAGLVRVPEDWPTPPFLFWIDTSADEIYRCESISGLTMTIGRAQEGTTAGTAGGGSTVYPLPEIRGHLEGKGAAPPVGIIEAESDDSGNRFTWTLTANASARLGNMLQLTPISGAGSAASDWLIDPHLLVPDDYTQGEIAIEVWGRMDIGQGLTSPVAILSAAPESATVASGVLSSTFGQIRYSEEYGSAGKALVKPSSGANWRFPRLGTIRFPVDRTRPVRWRLQVRVTWTNAISGEIGLDYLVLVPANQRALSPSGKVNDANYPKFVASTAETTKTIRSDLSGLAAKPPQAAQPDHGLGGSLLELPVGNVDWILKLSNVVPDDPTLDTTGDVAERPAGVVHLAVTPRVSLARGS